MAEMPERKVLQEVLMRLKKKTLTSEERHQSYAATVAKDSIGFFNRVHEIARGKGSLDVKTTLTVATLLHNNLKLLLSNVESVIEDMKLYIDALETYSGELDKTLWGAIEKAKKEAEEQIKEQQELRRKEPAYRV